MILSFNTFINLQQTFDEFMGGATTTVNIAEGIISETLFRITYGLDSRHYFQTIEEVRHWNQIRGKVMVIGVIKIMVEVK